MCLSEDDQEERAFRINQALEQDSHFNFPKLHLLSHYADQIAQHWSLPQYSTEICETSHKPLKDAYRRSNHVDTMPQIINAYTRDPNFGVRELNLEYWAARDSDAKAAIETVLCRSRTTVQFSRLKGEAVWMRLQNRVSWQEIGNLRDIGKEFMIPSIWDDVVDFFANNVYRSSEDPDADAKASLDHMEFQVFRGVEIPIPDQDVEDKNAYQLQHVRTTGSLSWRGKNARKDLVWVNLAESGVRCRTVKGRMQSFNNRLPAYLNGLFIIRYADGEIYKLAHVSLLRVIGSVTAHGPDGLATVEDSEEGSKVVRLQSLQGAAHLIPVEPTQKWIVNNRINYHTWNAMIDG